MTCCIAFAALMGATLWAARRLTGRRRGDPLAWRLQGGAS
jgi:hypothetical protein